MWRHLFNLLIFALNVTEASFRLIEVYRATIGVLLRFIIEVHKGFVEVLLTFRYSLLRFY